MIRDRNTRHTLRSNCEGCVANIHPSSYHPCPCLWILSIPWKSSSWDESLESRRPDECGNSCRIHRIRSQNAILARCWKSYLLQKTPWPRSKALCWSRHSPRESDPQGSEIEAPLLLSLLTERAWFRKAGNAKIVTSDGRTSKSESGSTEVNF